MRLCMSYLLRGTVHPMKRFFKVMAARRLVRTPIGLAILGVGWLVGRRRRRRTQSQAEQRSGADRGDRFTASGSRLPIR